MNTLTEEAVGFSWRQYHPQELEKLKVTGCLRQIDMNDVL